MTTTTAKRFTIAEYHRLAELGFFGEDDRVELIKGEIVQMAAKGTRHSTFNRRLIRELSKLLGVRATLQSQDPIVIPEYSEPEPDIAILRNREDDYINAHPSPADTLLLIEIADSTLSDDAVNAAPGGSLQENVDQKVKLPLYAEAGISDYWIFNLVENCLESYSESYQVQDKFGYRRKLIFLSNESVTLPCFPDLSLDLSKVFPKVMY